MSIAVAQQKRRILFGAIAGLLLMAVAVMAVSSRDVDGAWLRAGMVMLTAGAAFLLPWKFALPITLAVWLGPNYLRSVLGDETFINSTMLLELPGLLGLSAFAVGVRAAVDHLEAEHAAIGAAGAIDPATGVLDEQAMRPALEAELTRARRFERTLALVLVGIDDKHQRFAFRDEEEWHASYLATAQLLRRTRNNIDRVYRRGAAGFALILPESGEKEVTGLVRRLRRLAQSSQPCEGEPGGPLPVAFGATFFPASASSVEDLLRRAEIALRVSEKSWTRLQIDGAEAPPAPPPETLRQKQDDGTAGRPFSAPAREATSIETADAAIQAASKPALRLVPTPELVTQAQEQAGETGTQPAAVMATREAELTQLLSRMDETLSLIRSLRTS